VGCGLLLPAAASAEVAMFSQRSFQGARYALESESANMNFSPRSVRVSADQPWDLCPRPFFGGACITVSRNSDNLNLPRAFSGMVRSARPSKGQPAAEAPKPDAPKP
jgi:hypothetical protein